MFLLKKTIIKEFVANKPKQEFKVYIMVKIIYFIRIKSNRNLVKLILLNIINVV